MNKYYEINEELARLSKQSYSFSEYEYMSETNCYKKQVDYAYKLVDEVLEVNKEKALYYADMYAKKLAININKRFNINISCPSIMITGGSNFPVSKKLKQQERLGNAFKEYEQILKYLDKIKKLKFEKLKKEKKGISQDIDFGNEYFRVIQNEEANRLQLLFDEKPSEEQRNLLKKRGFKWSPKNMAWQRQLTNNALYSLKEVLNEFKKIN